MIFHILPSDNLNIIFDYIYQIIDIRCLVSTCTFFNHDKINPLPSFIAKKKKKIIQSFPILIIHLLGGYNDILHIQTLSNQHFQHIHDIHNLSLNYITSYLSKFDSCILLTNYASWNGLVLIKINFSTYYILYQEYSHSYSDWYIKYFKYTSINSNLYSRTNKLLEFKRGYLRYTDYQNKMPRFHFQLYPIISNIRNQLIC